MIHFAKRLARAGGLAAVFLLAMGTLAAAADAPYKVSVAGAKAKVGETSQIVVTVTAAEGWHVNYRYPHKLDNLSSAGGAELAFKSVGAKVASKSLTFSVSVKPTAAGVHAVTGEILFSLSQGTKKLTEKVPLKATVTGEKAGS